MYNIIKSPRTIKGLAYEINNVCDNYWARKIPEIDAKNFIIYWSKFEAEKLFKGAEINSTIRKIIGKKRTELLNKWLEGTQIEIYKN